MEQPVLKTVRLVLRPFALSDAPDVQRLASAWEVADTTLNMPHPYADGMAEQWISSQPQQLASGTVIVYAVTLQEAGTLLGAVSLIMTPRHSRAEIAYWLGVSFWNQGYMTEAAQAMVNYGFTGLGLHKITASHFARNPASGRVMQKLGMTQEGLLRQNVCCARMSAKATALKTWLYTACWRTSGERASDRVAEGYEGMKVTRA